MVVARSDVGFGAWEEAGRVWWRPVVWFVEEGGRGGEICGDTVGDGIMRSCLGVGNNELTSNGKVMFMRRCETWFRS